MQLYRFNGVPQYLMDYAEYAASYLGLDRLRGDVNIFIVPKLDGDVYGYCAGDGDEADVFIANRRFGEPVQQKYKMLTVGHELTHARQFLSRQLGEEEVADGQIMWKGRIVTFDPNDEFESPWEKEAVKYEKLIWKHWKEKYRYK